MILRILFDLANIVDFDIMVPDLASDFSKITRHAHILKKMNYM